MYALVFYMYASWAQKNMHLLCDMQTVGIRYK